LRLFSSEPFIASDSAPFPPFTPCLRMYIQPSLKEIPLGAINIGSYWNIHPFLDYTPSTFLKQSFFESGILHPPIVQATEDSTFDLVCGRKRLCALQHYYQHINRFPCLILPPTLTPREICLYVLTDQQLNGPLSPMETAFLLKQCSQKIDEQEITDFILPRLGHTGHKNQSLVIHQFVRLTTLDTKTQQLIHQGLIIDKIAFELLELPPEDQKALSSLFDLLQPGTGKQKRILSLSREIANRSGSTISSLLGEPEFKQMLDHAEMNIPQKTHSLLELLQKRSFPRSRNAEQVFKDRVQRLQLPAHYELNHSLNFEKDEVFLTVTFPNFESCEQAWYKMKDLLV
jgi:hypothetical protein